MGISIEAWDASAKGAPERWKHLMAEELKKSCRFEIHCWSDETAEIRMALAYGIIKATDWAYGTVITGEVTPDFIHFLLSLPEPDGNDLAARRMTPFFTIALDDGFWSEHYGTELNRAT